MALYILISGTQYTIVNIYAPYVKAKKDTFYKFFSTINLSCINLIVLGDFNCYVNLSRNRWPKSLEYYSGSKAIQDTMNSFDLIDTLPFDAYIFSTMSQIQKKNGIPVSATHIDAILDIHRSYKLNKKPCFNKNLLERP